MRTLPFWLWAFIVFIVVVGILALLHVAHFSFGVGVG